MSDSAEGPTPLTDAAEFDWTPICRGEAEPNVAYVVPADFARDLERRLAEAQEIGMTLQRNLGTAEKTNAMLAENWTNTEKLLAAERARADAQIEQLVDERDAAEETVSQIYFLVTGRSPEWSNEFGHEQATEEIVEATTLLRDSVKAERARAEAAVEMIEGFQREIAAQQERYNEEVAIVNRIWAIFGTPSYEELQGKMIYDLVQAAQNESQKYRAAEERAAAMADLLRRLMEKLREEASKDDPMEPFAYDAEWEALAIEADAALAARRPG